MSFQCTMPGYNTELKRRKRSQMTQNGRWVCHHGEGDLIKGFQEPLNGRLSCSPLGIGVCGWEEQEVGPIRGMARIRAKNHHKPIEQLHKPTETARGETKPGLTKA